MTDQIIRSLGRGCVAPGPRRFVDGTPIPVAVQFRDGSQIGYAMPRDTRDSRYGACTDHRVACDCREAEVAEDLGEYRAGLVELRAAIADICGGHGYGCRCTGCQIARRVAPHFLVPTWKGPIQ